MLTNIKLQELYNLCLLRYYLHTPKCDKLTPLCVCAKKDLTTMGTGFGSGSSSSPQKIIILYFFKGGLNIISNELH